ncbi:hypothetical protein EYV94_16215 [Puteibacter caeruleilacunae]|nr:hypothetical protein EYV94_16215 [Puteibacter caeruleilacunae]
MKTGYLLTIALMIAVSACKQAPKEKSNNITVVASTEKQWTGVAVSSNDRIFVNYPYWSDDVPVSVAEITDGKPVAYPNKAWNTRDNAQSFMAVQSVVVDNKDRLWVLDTRNPQFSGVVEGGPMLYQFNLQNNSLEHTYTFPKGVFQSNSYFNDVRIDTHDEMVYMTDSGNGALIVLNLKSGESRRILDNHHSTESEIDYLMCDGIKWENTVHSDGIALSPDNQYLYYIALTGHTLYRIKTSLLRDLSTPEEQLENNVEMVRAIPATDGMMFDYSGNLWLGGLEDNSINVLRKDGTVHKVLKDNEIRWADSFAKDSNGNIYFTTSQIHLPVAERKAYTVLRINPTDYKENTIEIK